MTFIALQRYWTQQISNRFQQNKIRDCELRHMISLSVGVDLDVAPAGLGGDRFGCVELARSGLNLYFDQLRQLFADAIE
ncbi:hypothetical protein [Nocardia fluminea]|uniref:hypothetical protein n=1 Tax=Nocardia fluminea TaxID=134984 RepID=UPI0033C745EA